MAQKKDYVAHTEKIDGVTFEFLSWDQDMIASISLNKKSERVAQKVIMKNHAKNIAKVCKKAGFIRVQIGSIGDFHHANVPLGRDKVISLDTMHIARLLKR